MRMMKRLVFILTTLFVTQMAFSQSYNTDRTALANFLRRMYNNAPFDGVRIVDDYEKTYLISVLSLDKSKYPNESAMSRVASVKAMSQASTFFNGSNVTSDLIIRTSEKSDGSEDTEIIEHIKEHSVGYVKALELLISFDKGENGKVFLFIKQMNPLEDDKSKITKLN